jgi:hypothetical protein
MNRPFARTPVAGREARSLGRSRTLVGVAAFALGCLWASLVLYEATRMFGGPSALLQVGTSNPLYERIRGELGPLPAAGPVGHDGQLFYSVARDPLGRHGTPQAFSVFDSDTSNGPAYRYRRILYPVLAGGFGWFSGPQTLVGMIVLVAVAFGGIGWATADLSAQWKRTPDAAIVALANPALLLTCWLLEADPIAVALALAGLALALRDRWRLAAVFLACAVLTKETYLLMPWSLAGWLSMTGRRRLAAWFVIATGLPLAIWAGYLWSTMPGGQGAANFGLPFAGLLNASHQWVISERNPTEWICAAVAVLLLWRAGVTFYRGTHLMRWLVGPWVLIGCAASAEVWGKPNNAARALAILWPLTVLPSRNPSR